MFEGKFDTSKLNKIKEDILEKQYLYLAVCTGLAALIVNNAENKDVDLDVNLVFSTCVLVVMQLVAHFREVIQKGSDDVGVQLPEIDEQGNLVNPSLQIVEPEEDECGKADVDSENIIFNPPKRVQEEMYDMLELYETWEESDDYESDHDLPKKQYFDYNNEALLSLSDNDYVNATNFLGTNFKVALGIDEQKVDVSDSDKEKIMSYILDKLPINVTISILTQGKKLYKIGVNENKRYYLFEVLNPLEVDQDSVGEQLVFSTEEDLGYTYVDLLKKILDSKFPKLIGYGSLSVLNNFEKQFLSK